MNLDMNLDKMSQGVANVANQHILNILEDLRNTYSPNRLSFIEIDEEEAMTILDNLIKEYHDLLQS